MVSRACRPAGALLNPACCDVDRFLIAGPPGGTCQAPNGARFCSAAGKHGWVQEVTLRLGKLLAAARAETRPLLMGVVNVTPDSFFDGGRYVADADALSQVESLVSAGAELIDIGAESSRPGAPEVPAEEQLRRLGTTVQRAAALGVVVSVDTTSPAVAEVALSEGAQLINDVSCLRDPGLASVVATHDGWLALMHSRGPMTAMSGFSEWPADDYPDIVSDVARDWGRARQTAVALGVKAEQIVFDPGLGFSKNATHSYALLRELWRFRDLGAATLVGPSRKSFIAAADPSTPAQRLGGTIAACLIAAANGADILRVHDVFEVRQALRVLAAVRRPDLLANPKSSAKGQA